MLSRRIAAVQPLGRAVRPAAAVHRPFSTAQPRRQQLTEAEDPDMNGAYPNPPPVKRQHRDPYAPWWDQQERRNFGEPVHEDNDVLGILSTEDYQHFSQRRGLMLWGFTIATFAALMATVKMLYPDKPAAPRTFPGGLDEELGGQGALRARKEGEDEW
ncbi:NADH:ubiquinone oxidoreductase 20.1kD subunit [Lineolata rhizophorae]|uniref:NADH:ubiquinone oxidoreductase 20.1kD subunit n=1 Tax=Lineolata rhizophorae TaxID=578093 RepID=A0A6A6NNW9_9PEZI|nr:NADH:ubiquinone oxidoreductase 20.1kD subunit [Lineolata rhizophorae]